MVTDIDLLITLHLLDLEVLIATKTPEQVPKSRGNYIPAGHLFSNTPEQVPKHPETKLRSLTATCFNHCSALCATHYGTLCLARGVAL